MASAKCVQYEAPLIFICDEEVVQSTAKGKVSGAGAAAVLIAERFMSEVRLAVLTRDPTHPVLQIGMTRRIHRLSPSPSVPLLFPGRTHDPCALRTRDLAIIYLLLTQSYFASDE